MTTRPPRSSSTALMVLMTILRDVVTQDGDAQTPVPAGVGQRLVIVRLDGGTPCAPA